MTSLKHAVSSVYRLEPQDETQPCDFYITYETSNGLRQSHFTVDTEVSEIRGDRAQDEAISIVVA